MPTYLPTATKSHFPWRMLAVAGLVGLITPAKSWANSVFLFSMNTTGLSGGAGYLAFNLINGNDKTDATATVDGFLVTGGAMIDASSLALTEVPFFNEGIRSVTFGSALNFSVTINPGSPANGFPDSFSFFLLDPAKAIQVNVSILTYDLLPGFSTDAPNGSNTVFRIDFGGSNGGGGQTVFDSTTTNVTWSLEPLQPVPDQGGTLLLGGLSLAVLGVMHRWQGRRRSSGSN